MQEFTEHVFTTSVFNKPLVLKDKDAILTIIVRIILMDPGTYSMIPEAGVGLVKRYRYLDSDNIPQLEQDIRDQIDRFLPYFRNVDCKITLNQDKILFIELDIDDDVYTLKSTMNKNNEFSLDRLF